MPKYALLIPPPDSGPANAVSWDDAADSVQKGAGNWPIAVHLEQAEASPVVVSVQLGGTAGYGLNYTTSPAPVGGVIPLSIPAGQISATIDVQVLQVLGTETIDFAITGTDNPEVVVGDPALKVVTITDVANSVAWDDATDVYQENTQATVHAALARSEPEPVTVQVALSGTAGYGTEYTTVPAPSGGVISVPVAAGLTDVPIAITMLSVPADRTIVLTITGTDSGIPVGAPAVKTVTIQDVAGVPRPSGSNTGPRLSTTWETTLVNGGPLTNSWLSTNSVQHPGNVFMEGGRWILYRIKIVGQIIMDPSVAPLTIRDCHFDAGNCIVGQSSQNCLSGGSGHLVEYTRLEGSTSPAFNGNGWTFEHCRFTLLREHGFQGGYNNTFRYNLFDLIGLWLDDNNPNTPDSPHSEAGILFQGNNFTFEYNYVDLPYPMPPPPPPPPTYTGFANPTACINFQADVSNGNGNDIQGVKCNNNWFNGGGYTVYLYEIEGAQIISLELKNNRFTVNYQEAPLAWNFDYIARAGVVVSGNIWWDEETNEDGALITDFPQE